MITVRFNNEFGRNIGAVGLHGCSLATLPAVICNYSGYSHGGVRVEIIVERAGTRAVTSAYMNYVSRHLALHGLRLGRIVERTLKSSGRAQLGLWTVVAH